MRGQIKQLGAIILILIVLVVVLGIIYVLSGKAEIMLDRIKDLIAFR